MAEEHEVGAEEAVNHEEQAEPRKHYKDFGAEVRWMFEAITSDALSPQDINKIIAFKFGTRDCSDALDDFYSDFLLQQARYDIEFVISIEDTLEHFIQFMPGISTYDFHPMPAIKRKIIHELCVHYGCTSLSCGIEPDRFVRVTLNRGRVPQPKLSEVV